jgi:hypothetical protein
MEFASISNAKSLFIPDFSLMIPGLMLPVITRYATSRLAFVSSTKNGPGIYRARRMSHIGSAILSDPLRHRTFRAIIPVPMAIIIPAMISSIDQKRILPEPATRRR